MRKDKINMNAKYFPLTDIWKNDLDAKRNNAKNLVENFTGKVLKGKIEDLETLQNVIDSNIIDKNDIITFQALGVLLGDIISKETDSEWCMIEDDYGEDPTLKIRGKRANINALTIISKRIEENREINLNEIYDGIIEYLNTQEFGED